MQLAPRAVLLSSLGAFHHARPIVQRTLKLINGKWNDIARSKAKSVSRQNFNIVRFCFT